VINVNGSGVFVRLDNVFVDGFIHIKEVGHEHYRFDNEAMKLMGDGGDTIGIGSKIQVQIGNIDMGKRTIGLIRKGF
jgi:ribonuclease R